MLIIAIPKSASSSLAALLCERHGLTDDTGELRDRHLGDNREGPARGFQALAHLHRREIREIPEQFVVDSTAPGRLAKHHIAPTPHNQDLLRSHKKVILLRNPDDVVLGYMRGDETGAFPMRGHDYSLCFSARQWLSRARKTGLLAELDEFCRQWELHDGNKLVIRYEDLLENPKRTINAVEAYLGLAQSADVALPRRKYSRESEDRARPGILRSLWRRRQHIAWRLSRLAGLHAIAKRIRN